MAEMKNFNGEILEQRDCFKKDAHGDHKWHDLYYCLGRGLDHNMYVRESREMKYWAGERIPVRACGEMTQHEEHSFGWVDDDEQIREQSYCPGVSFDDAAKMADALSDKTTPAPGILDGRAAYGDRVQNMKEQAAMINAYLGTPPRAIEAHDVPIIFVLIKAHRLGKMPDYADNYNDIDGYMQIAREVIGDDMIEAATAKEYSQLKAVRNANTNVVEAKAVQAWLADHGVVSDVVTIDHGVPPRHQYENVERDEFTASILDSHDPGVHELPKPRHQYENVERDAERDAMNERLRQSRNA
ncbi:hypothetical protein SEA_PINEAPPLEPLUTO_7 [Microbacterium phage PineapplePluto]|nr:hypothetical protein SEA_PINEAPPLEPLUTO_7 [Microbacterium phage PineapplePluto]